VQLVDKQFSKDPRIAVDLLMPIAGQYQTLGDTNKEYAVMQRAATIAQTSGDPQLIASVACNTVDTNVRRGRVDSAKEQLRTGQAALAQLPQPSVVSVTACVRAEAEVAQAEGDFERAAERIGTALALAERSGQTRGSGYRALLTHLNQLQRWRGDLAASYALMKKAQRLDEDNGRTESIDYLGAKREEATTLLAWGEVREAQSIIEPLVVRWRALGEDGAAPPWFDSTRAALMLRMGDVPGAHKLLVSVAERVRAQGSAPAIVMANLALAQALLALGRLDEAEAALQAVEGAPASRSAGRPWRTTPATLRAELLLARGETLRAGPVVEAELARLGYAGAQPSLPSPAAPSLATALCVAAQVSLALADARRAEAFASAAVAVSVGVARAPEASADVGEALLRLAQAQGLAGSATQSRASAQRAAGALAAGLGDEHRLTLQARGLMAVEHSRESPAPR
jgi:ATP/maltotriose-dependent transcriptional regulator MalT